MKRNKRWSPKPPNIPARYKGKGEPCEQGETAAQSGCIPATGEGHKKPSSSEEIATVNEAKPSSKLESGVTVEDRTRLGVGQPIEVSEDFENVSLPSYLEASQHAAEILPEEVREALLEYSYGNEYRLLNEAMRKCPDTLDCLPPKLARMLATIDKAFAIIPPFSKPIPTYRAINVPSGVLDALVEEAEQAIESGNPLRLPSVTSTTLNPATMERFFLGKMPGEDKLVFKIQASHGIPMGTSDLSYMDHEQELLLSHRSSYRVIAVEDAEVQVREKKHSKVKVIYLEQVT